MRAWLTDRSATFDAAVQVDDVVIADITPSALIDVVLLDVFCPDVLALDGSRTMDDDLVDQPHTLAVIAPPMADKTAMIRSMIQRILDFLSSFILFVIW